MLHLSIVCVCLQHVCVRERVGEHIFNDSYEAAASTVMYPTIGMAWMATAMANGDGGNNASGLAQTEGNTE